MLTTVRPTIHLLGVRRVSTIRNRAPRFIRRAADHTISASVMAAERAKLKFDTMSEPLITDEERASILAPRRQWAGRCCWR